MIAFTSMALFGLLIRGSGHAHAVAELRMRCNAFDAKLHTQADMIDVLKLRKNCACQFAGKPCECKPDAGCKCGKPTPVTSCRCKDLATREDLAHARAEYHALSRACDAKPACRCEKPAEPTPAEPEVIPAPSPEKSETTSRVVPKAARCSKLRGCRR